MYKESTIEGTHQIIEDIFARQFKIDEKDKQWTNCLRLVFGDTLTTMRLHTFKEERSVEDGAFEGLKWLLPVFGLWHLRQSYLKLLHDHFWCSKESQGDSSTLFSAHSHWYQSQTFSPAQFQRLEELVIQTWQSNVIGVMIQILKDDGHFNASKPQYMDICRAIGSLKETGVTTLTDNIISRVGSYYARSKRMKVKDRDEEWLNHTIFMRNVTPYLMLKAAIKHADIGILRFAINECCICFAGQNRPHYTRDLLFYKWLTDTKASDIRLQEAILYGSLVNREGRKDSYYERDRAGELLNQVIKEYSCHKRTSSISPQLLLGRYAQVFKFWEEQRDVFGEVITHKMNAYHTRKDLGDQIYSLADWYVGSNFMKEIPGRVSRFRPPDFMAEGVGDALDEKVAKFNEWVDQKTGLRNLLRISENWTDLNQEPKDNEFMNLEAVPDGDLEIAAQADAEDQIIGSETDLSDTDSGTLY